MAVGRSVWSGFIQFGLVSVPVKAFTAAATGGGEIKLNQLHKECHSRIQYKKTCPTHGELKAEDIVSGYEFDKGRYVVVEPDELEKLRSAGEKAIAVKAFIPPDKIDSRYYNGKTWYLLPDGPVAKPYALLLKAMDEQELFAFTQVVISGKEQLLLLRPMSGLLVGSFVSFNAELKSLDDFKDDAPKIEVTAEELKLAKTLTDAMKQKDFDIAEYKDDFTEKMTQLVQAKIEGKQIVTPPAEEAPAVINLMDALKKSLAQAKKSAIAKPPKLAAPSAGVAARESRKRKIS